MPHNPALNGKLVPGRTTDAPSPETEREARSVFKDPKYRTASEHVIKVLNSGHFRDQGRAKEMTMCGRRPAVVFVREGQAFSYLHARCRQRLCPFCQAMNAAEVRTRLEPVIAERLAVGARFSMLTVTFPHQHGDSLRDLFRVLMNALRYFTRSTEFRKHVRGWARGVEVTYGANGFHPHAHFILECKYWELRSLHRCWARAVSKAGGPDVPFQGVDILALEVDPHRGLNEALGYPFKAADLGATDLATLRELQISLRGRHLVQSCKAWGRRAKVLEEERKELALVGDEEAGVTRISFVELMRQCHRPESRTILVSLADLLAPDEDFRQVVAIIRDALDVNRRITSCAPTKTGWLPAS